MQPPTVRLSAGIHDGPLVLDRAQNLVGDPGAVVRGGIVVTADNVTIRNVTVVGGENGIEVDDAHNVTLDHVRISGAKLDGIHVRRSSVSIRVASSDSSAGDYAQGIDISFGFDLAPSIVEDCTVVGGRERDRHPFRPCPSQRQPGQRRVAPGSHAYGDVDGRGRGNDVSDSLGVGIFCGDYSECEIDDNSVDGIRPDDASGDKTRMGFAILAHYGAKAVIGDNHVSNSPGGTDAVLGAEISVGE
jgi:hypothetical protein